MKNKHFIEVSNICLIVHGPGEFTMHPPPPATSTNGIILFRGPSWSRIKMLTLNILGSSRHFGWFSKWPPWKLRKVIYSPYNGDTCSPVSHGTAALNVSNMEKIRYRNSPSVVALNYFPWYVFFTSIQSNNHKSPVWVYIHCHFDTILDLLM